ncbi:uncharacterized protein BDV17DRAFT_275676 [Aspergillus undulatus]|uniref:uncharacterized protein n=1 Tax=Aspergillus undulatus TaxID=1810928 RepID=UPI003CCDB8F2
MSSSSSPPHHQPSYTTATASSGSPVGSYHDIEDNNTNEMPENYSDTPEEPAYDSDLEEVLPRQRRRRQGSLWARGLSVVSPFIATSAKHKTPETFVPLFPRHSKYSKLYPKWFRKSNRSCCCLYFIVGFFTMLGIFQFISLACSIVISFFPDELDRVTARWRQPQDVDPADATRWPTDISRDIVPIACHSHNDYWRRVPLYSALAAGCIGVEADVWLVDDELFVGHTRPSLTPSRTLRSMYVDPLMSILRRQNPITHFHPDVDQPPNGVFDTNPLQSLIFLIDFKTDGNEIWDYVYSQLAPLRESGYLTYWNGNDTVNGPITVVATGNAPFNRVIANSTYRDIFFDAPLDRIVESADRIDESTHIEKRNENAGQGLSGIDKGGITPDTFNATNSYYASVSFKKAVGTPWMLHLTDRQVQTIRSQIRAAHRQGLKVRYWGTPDWPRSLRNHVWRVLAREGVDMLNVDDLVSAARKDWAPSIFDWWH